MKRIYFSLATIAILLFTACTNDVPGNDEANEGGTLTATISFESITPALKTTPSTAIPTVGWGNVKQVQLFLYDAATGQVAFSRTVQPTAAVQTFTWNNVPAGPYRLALLANVKSSSDDMATWVSGSPAEFDENLNVLGRKFNSDLQIGLKSSTLPGMPHNWGTPTPPRTAYAPPSEVFTAYKDVTISANALTTVPATDLVLRREVSLMRVRINETEYPNIPAGNRAKLSFNNANNFIAIQTLPVGFGLKVGSFDGGILDTPSDASRVMVCATGTGTYKTSDPTAGYSPLTILDTDHTMWNDIRVLPNASASERTSGPLTNASDAPAARKYFIIISAWVDAGYEFADGSMAATARPVYWYGIIHGVFTKNVIREVNMKLMTAGYPGIPEEPVQEGGLEITIGAPENWNSVIEVSLIEA